MRTSLFDKAIKALSRSSTRLVFMLFLIMQISNHATAQRSVKSLHGLNWTTGAEGNETTKLHLNQAGNLLIYGLNGENVSTISQTLLNKYSLFVEEGVLSEDFAMAPGASWADHVFEEDYKLLSLQEVETFIKNNKHLPNIPSQTEIEKEGYSMHIMNIKMLEKIEELTLHAIEQQKEIKLLKQQVQDYETLKAEFEALKKTIQSKE